jgi:hypothetical protein
MIGLAAEARSLNKALKDAGDFKIDSSAAMSALSGLKSKIQSLGIADLADVNVQPGRLMTQLQLLKRLIHQAGISDMLDVNVDAASLANAMRKISSEKTVLNVPIKFDMSKMPQSGLTGAMSEKVDFSIDPSKLAAANNALKIMNTETLQVADAVKKMKTGFDGIGLSPNTIAAMNAAINDATRLNAGFGDVGRTLGIIRTAIGDVIGKLIGVGTSAQASYIPLHAMADPTMSEAFKNISSSTDGASSSQRLFTNALLNGYAALNHSRGGWAAWNNGIRLFGGQMQQLLPNLGAVGTHLIAFASYWHITAEAIIETAGTLIPAAIAFATFAAAAAPTVQDIYNRMNALNTVSVALGKTIYPLTGGFDKMIAAVRPDVMNLFGQALEVVNAKSGLFVTVASGAGQVMKDLGARMTYAIAGTQGLSPALQKVAKDTGAAAGSSNTLNTVLGHSVTDLQGWGTGLGNLAGIFGGIMKVLPGYAEMVMNAFNGVTHAIETMVNSTVGQWLLQVGLAAHGALFYIGLLSTAFAVLATKSIPLVAGAVTQAANALAGLGFTEAATAVDGFAAKISSLSNLPWGWIGIVAAAVGYLAYSMATGKDAAEKYTASVQAGLQNLPIDKLQPALTNALDQATTKMNSMRGSVAANTVSMSNFHLGIIHANSVMGELITHTDSIAKSPSIIGSIAGAWVSFSHAVGLVKTPMEDAQAAQKQFSDDSQLVNQRVGALGKAFGSTKAAWAALNAAGVTSAQILDKNSNNWAKTLIEVQAAQNAFEALNLGVGRSAAALNAMVGGPLNKVGDTFVGTLVPAAQKVVQAEDQLLGILTSGSSALDTYGQGLYTLATNMKQAGVGTGTVSTKLGTLSAKASMAGAAIGGTSAASYALNGAFYAQLGNAQKVTDALTMQQASTKQVTTATATMGGQMVSFAGTNEAARVAIVDYINNALGPGTVSLQTLNTWTKNNSTSMGGLNAIIGQAQVAASKLAGTLQQDLNAQFNQALLASSGATDQIKKYAQEVANGTANTSAGVSTRAQLIADLEKTGMSAQDSTNYVNNLQKNIDSMHGKTVPVNASTGQALTDLSYLQNTIDGIHGKTVIVSVVMSAATSGVGIAGKQATGGPVITAASGGARGNMTLVGEHGPELVKLPPGGTVFSNSDSQRMWAGRQGGGPGGPGGGGTLQLEVSPSGSSAFEQFIVLAMRNYIRVRGGNVQNALGH